MSVSTYTNTVLRLEKDIAALQKKAGQEREKAGKERQAAVQKRGQIGRNTSDSQRLGKEKEASGREVKAAKFDIKAAEFDHEIGQKNDQLKSARASLKSAQASEDKRDDAQRKQARQRERRELDEIERRRRQAQSAPDFEPQALAWRGEPVGFRGEPEAFQGEPISPVGDPAPASSQEEAPEFDVCLSFAGEQRSYVELVARGLKDRGYKVFYDADEQASLWGKNLTEHFEYVYRVASRACVMFISKEYAEKPWTKHERRSALARALEEDEYVLPARFDETELPGLAPTIGYIDLAQFAPASLVDLLAEKLGEAQGAGARETGD